VVEDGYEFFAQRKLITVFSAPNYCGTFDNAGALMSVNSDLLCSFQVSGNAYPTNISINVNLDKKISRCNCYPKRISFIALVLSPVSHAT
jgi:hypothetical protein